jgi:cellulose 1,4-beta-cellobiosidase
MGTACAGASSQQPAGPPAVVLGQTPQPLPPPVPKIKAMPVEAAKTPPAPPGTNPFQGARFYVNSDYMKKVQSTAAAVPEKAALIKKLGNQPTAFWLDSIAKVPSINAELTEVAKQQGGGEPVVSVFVVYDLPNRDCSAQASAGELTTENGGEARYRSEFIDAIVKQFAAFPKQRIVAILEPDSLPNLATNLSVKRCAESEDVYKNSVAYAISKLSLPNVHVYLDAAHAGWLGWDGNRHAIAEIYKQVLAMAGGPDRIRGFATNVSNYNAIAGDFGKKLEPTNPCPNELAYVEKLAATLPEYGITNKGFIIDTARNGRADVRTKWGNWCNIRGAGLGERPRVAPQAPVDAYYWVKPPGESDGVADPKAPRFDPNCQSPDAAPGAPQAGQWVQSYFLDLLQNANPPL